jgi:membrane-associated phospholipid phosphatase
LALWPLLARRWPPLVDPSAATGLPKPSRAVRILGRLTAGLAIGTTAFSRVELGVHWLTDVIAGVVFVAIWMTAIDRARRWPPAA